VASAGPDVRVTTIEINPDHAHVAELAIEHAGMSDRIEVLLGAGVEVLPKLRAEIQNGTRPKFDFVFIDADKPNNLNYYNEAIAMCRSRACIIVDNVVRRGMVADDRAADEDERVMGARKVRNASDCAVTVNVSYRVDWGFRLSRSLGQMRGSWATA
jgi:predicted O-methyltransferase YrrM